MDFQQGLLFRAFVGEGDRCESKPLYQWLIDLAHAEGLAGATVLRGMEGFGADGRMHTSRVLRLSVDLPLVVEIVDSAEKIEAFLALLDGRMDKGVVTVEPIRYWPAAGDGERTR